MKIMARMHTLYSNVGFRYFSVRTELVGDHSHEVEIGRRSCFWIKYKSRLEDVDCNFLATKKGRIC